MLPLNLAHIFVLISLNNIKWFYSIRPEKLSYISIGVIDEGFYTLTQINYCFLRIIINYLKPFKSVQRNDYY